MNILNFYFVQKNDTLTHQTTDIIKSYGIKLDRAVLVVRGLFFSIFFKMH